MCGIAQCELAIAFGYEDANDLGVMRTDRVFKLACGRLPDTDAATAMHFQGSPANRASSSRAAFSSSVDLGNPNALIILLKALVSSSTNVNNSLL